MSKTIGKYGTLCVRQSNLIRAVSFHVNGQRHEGGLPAGTYTIGARVNLTTKQGSREMLPAIELHRDSLRWYVRPGDIGQE